MKLDANSVLRCSFSYYFLTVSGTKIISPYANMVL